VTVNGNYQPEKFKVMVVNRWSGCQSTYLFVIVCFAISILVLFAVVAVWIGMTWSDEGRVIVGARELEQGVAPKKLLGWQRDQK